MSEIWGEKNQIVAVVDGRCGCSRCEQRTSDVYRMVGFCRNCGAKSLLMLFRAGDRAADQDCPVCGNWHSARPVRLARPDEIPAEVV